MNQQKFFQAFELLEIKPTINPDAIQKAYKVAAAKYHPDRFQTTSDKQRANEIFIAVTKNRDFLLSCIQEQNFLNSFDATPLHLGYKDTNGMMKIIIRAGTIIPCKLKELIGLVCNSTGECGLEIYQGLRPLVEDNFLLAKITMTPNGPDKGYINLYNFIFQIDENGILQISAEDIEMGNKQNIKIDYQLGMTENSIEQHKKWAQTYLESDRKKAEDFKI